MPTQINIDEVRNRISMINQQSAQINQQRQMNLGRKQQLESQLAQLYSSYMQKYGIDLNKVDLNTELEKVVNEKASECSKMEAVLAAIGAKDYAKANELLGINTSSGVSQPETPVVASEPTTTVDEQMANFTNTDVVKNNPVSEQPVAAPVAPPTMEAPVTPPVMTPSVESVPTSPVSVAAPPSFNTPVSAPTQQEVVTPPSFMQGVVDTPNVYEPTMDALAGFTKGGLMSGISGLSEPSNQDVVAKPTAPTTFADLMGGTVSF